MQEQRCSERSPGQVYKHASVVARIRAQREALLAIQSDLTDNKPRVMPSYQVRRRVPVVRAGLGWCLGSGGMSSSGSQDQQQAGVAMSLGVATRRSRSRSGDALGAAEASRSSSAHRSSSAAQSFLSSPPLASSSSSSTGLFSSVLGHNTSAPPPLPIPAANTRSTRSASVKASASSSAASTPESNDNFFFPHKGEEATTDRQAGSEDREGHDAARLWTDCLCWGAEGDAAVVSSSSSEEQLARAFTSSVSLEANTSGSANSSPSMSGHKRELSASTRLPR